MRVILFTFLVMSFSLLFNSSAYAQERSCGTTELMEQLLQDPDYRQQHLEKLRKAALMAEQRVETRNNGCSNTIVIPVAVHYQRLKRNQINEQCLTSLALNQIQILNEDYQGTNMDLSNWTNGTSSLFPGISNGEACIEFCLATKNHPGGYGLSDGDYAVTFNQTSGDRASAWSGYINIFVRNINYLGYSPLGGSGNGDGVVIDNEAFGSGSGCPGVSPGAPYNLGRTLTHELGHYLLLGHIWGGGCGSDDGIADTPDQSGPNYGCPSSNTQSCGSLDMHMNYMDYTNDACMYMFSAGQTARMENYVNTDLSNVINKGLSVCGNGNPTESTCDDGVRNGNETGIDCGGPDCDPCDDPPTTCDAPSNLQHNRRRGGREAWLSWDAVSGATSYEFNIKVAGTNSWESYEVTSTNIIRPVTRGVNYDWRVKANCGSDMSAWSTSIFNNRLAGRQGINNDAFVIYPNPASNNVNIILELEAIPSDARALEVIEENTTTIDEAQLSVMDITGRVISTQEVSNFSTVELDISNMNSGLYIIRVNYDGDTFVKKLVVKK